MTPHELWERYSAIWSADSETRERELQACLSDEATYCDPNGTVVGRTALSAYMGAFQEAVPHGTFRIEALHHHHDKTLAAWTLRGANGEAMQHGTSFATLSEDGRLAQITGFFPQ